MWVSLNFGFVTFDGFKYVVTPFREVLYHLSAQKKHCVTWIRTIQLKVSVKSNKRYVDLIKPEDLDYDCGF